MKKTILVIFTVLLAFGSLASHAIEQATAQIINVEGRVIGKALLGQGPTGVLIFIEANDLPPGPHGIHLHSVGKCGPDFKAAKGHINPHKRPHGLLKPGGPDRGDLPNVIVPLDGTLTA